MINISNFTSKKSTKKYIFSDLDLNFEQLKVSENKINNDFAPGNDLAISTDREAIKNSIKNLLFQTRYLTNININLKSYIGEPISEFRGLSIGEDIERILTLYENRVVVQKIIVGADIDNSRYLISMFLRFKNLGETFNLYSTFNTNGNFEFINT
jgi:hypothetical protein